MRGEADEQLIRKVISELGQSATGPGTVYLVGGCSVVLEGLRNSTQLRARTAGLTTLAPRSE